jgi:hypothetical protein
MRHSQTTWTCQPRDRNSRLIRLSRATFLSNFGIQYPKLPFGRRKSGHGGAWRCQKHPLTKNTPREAGTTMSGVPGSRRTWRRYFIPTPRNAERTSNSGPVFFFRNWDIRMAGPKWIDDGRRSVPGYASVPIGLGNQSEFGPLMLVQR